MAPRLTGASTTVPPLTEPWMTPAFAEFLAAESAAGPATDEDGAEATATVPLPAFRRRLLRLSSPAGPAALGGATPVARAARRLMVTPWFAVAAGFVVAAGVWLYSPHATLQFPTGKSGEQPCKPPQCKATQQQITGTQAGAARMPVTSGGSVGRVPTHAPRKVTYRLLWQSQGRFSMLITVYGRHALRPRPWRLTFDMPGVVITGIEGARWQPSGTGGTASWPVAGAPWQSAGLGGNGDQYGTAGRYGAGRSFVVIGKGVFGMPVDCHFNKTSCKFTFAASTAEANWLQSR